VANDAGTDQGQQKAQGNHHEERNQLSQRATLEHDLMLHHGAATVLRSRSISPRSSGMRSDATSGGDRRAGSGVSASASIWETMLPLRRARSLQRMARRPAPISRLREPALTRSGFACDAWFPATMMRACAVAALAAWGHCLPAFALVLGGGSPQTDCWAAFDGVNATTGTTVSCTDSDPTCDADERADGTCTYRLRICLDVNDGPECRPEPIHRVRLRGFGLGFHPIRSFVPPLPVSTETCGPFGEVRVPTTPPPTTAPSPSSPSSSPYGVSNSRRLSMVAFGRRGRRDRDRLKLVCLPARICEAACCPSPAGGPTELDLSVNEVGSDLDLGWTGTSHNFPVDPRASLKLCLSGCDASTNPVCDVMGLVGTGSMNGATFGPPLPLIAQGVAVCVINRYQSTPVTGKLNVQTGEGSDTTPIQVNLFSDVHLISDHTNVCPRCSTGGAPQYGARGSCSAGPNQGKSCTVESILTVAQSQGSPTYGLSAACPPDPAAKAATLDIKLPLTTGTSTLAGPTPCPGQVQQDNCQGSPCDATCTGQACVSYTPEGQCVDAKGGLSQVCCAGDTAMPCFPDPLVRTGFADPPAPVWPDLTYPKRSTKGVLVTTFCVGATSRSTINTTDGLPGPGAIILPVTETLLRAP